MKRWPINIAVVLLILISTPDFSISFEEKHDEIYTGRKIDIVMENADIRKVLLLFGECAGMNMVIKDNVSGRITLRLKNVPWDQAFFLLLDIFNLKAEVVDDTIVIGRDL
jgi:type IV pilus assembly protein PilQ